MSSTIKKPNFFIVGFPKCGTTTLSHYLASHPDVFFSQTTWEPHYFNTDFPHVYRKFFDEKTYLTTCYSGSAGYPAVGESSPLFVYSKEAIPNILKFNPEAKFIVLIRDPVELARSHHTHALKKGYENVEDFETAWRLQEKCRHGKAIPRGCEKPFSIQYGERARIGTYLQRLYQNTPTSSVAVIFLDDLRDQPRQTYRQVLGFLGLSDDGKSDFAVYNQNAQWRSPLLRSSCRSLKQVKKRWGIKNNFGFVSFLKTKGMTSAVRKPLSPGFQEELREFFQDEIETVSSITKRNLSHWIDR